MPSKRIRQLCLVLGDQLNRDSSLFDEFDVERDAVWMAEVGDESKHVWTHKARIAIFLSAMRHFRDALLAEGIDVRYRELGDRANRGDLGSELEAVCKSAKPERLIVVQPGEWRVLDALQTAAKRAGVELEVREDRHFFCSLDDFAKHKQAANNFGSSTSTANFANGMKC